MVRFKLVVSLLSLYTVMGGAALAQDLSIGLTLDRKEYSGSDPVLATYVVTNNGSRPVWVLKWDTPFDSLSGRKFSVVHAGVERAFLGARVTRGHPTKNSWLKIGPHKSANATVDLAQAFDLSSVGDYEVRVDGGFGHVALVAKRLPSSLNDLHRHPLKSNKIGFSMLTARKRVQSARPEATSFTGCSTTQTFLIANAINTTTTDATDLNNKVKGWTCSDWNDSNPATTFMGSSCSNQSYMSAVQQTVAGVVASVGDPITYNCGGSCGGGTCTDDTIAFTCGAPEIYLCGLFFAGDFTNQPATLYHELAHWSIPNPISTEVYGCQDCEDLSHADAEANAQNYMYFEEYQTSGQNPCGAEGAAMLAILAFAVQGVGRGLLARTTLRIR